MKQAENNDTVMINFTYKPAEGDVIDTPIEHKSLIFTIGEGNVFPVLEKAVIGMNIGDSKTTKISTEKAFGQYYKDIVRANNNLAGKNLIFDIKLLNISKVKAPRTGLWNHLYSSYNGPREVYDDDFTMRKGAAFLNTPDIKIIEDWGCGLGGFKNYVGEHQQYIGIDGSDTPYVDKKVDLEEYTTKVDAIFMRHVLEHNPNWEKILKNAISSFVKRMVLIIFTPFVEKSQIIKHYPNYANSNITMVDIAFKKEDIIRYFSAVNMSSEENIETKSQYKFEHIFYLSK